MTNKLFYGDNLDVLRESIATESVDLVYLDPPFNSAATYNVLFRSPSGEQSQAQIEAFEDTWHWNEKAERAFSDVEEYRENSQPAVMLRAMRATLGDNDMMAYLAMMAVRLIELNRVLKKTGSLYLHCDPTASHYLKIVMDAILGAENFRSEIIWQRTPAHSSAKRYAPVHDTIFYYQKSGKRIWNEPRIGYEEEYLDKYYKYDDGDGKLYWRADVTGAGIRTGDSGKPWRDHDPSKIHRHWAIPKEVIATAVGSESAANMTAQQKLEVLDGLNALYFPDGGGMPQYKRYRHQLKGKSLGDVWTDVDRINPVGDERLGYPTQKPVALLERILSASSNPGDIILDPFCGCGTTIHAAQKLSRQWLGIDITHLAISLIERRLKDAFPGLAYEVVGTPRDLAGARDLAKRDPYQFQWWATSLIDAVPAGGKKKGMDRGIDGYLNFRDEAGKPAFGIVSVKGGESRSPDMIRVLKTVVEREKAALGVFISLAEPTREMTKEAASAGFYETGGKRFPKIQMLTIKQLFDGRKPEVPFGHVEGFKKAPKEKPSGSQGALF